MKRFSIAAVLCLVGSLAGIVGTAAPAHATNGASEVHMLTGDTYGHTFTYGTAVSYFGLVFDRSFSCENAFDCDQPSGQVVLTVDSFTNPPFGIADLSGFGDNTSSWDLTYAGLPAGDHRVYAKYVASGPNQFDESSTSDLFHVDKVETTTTLSEAPQFAPYGTSVKFTVQVTPNTTPDVSHGALPISGLVDILEGAPGNTTIYGSANIDITGKAEITTTQIEPGSHDIRAVYHGTDNYAGSTSNIVQHGTSQITTDTALRVSTNSAAFGAPVTLTATVAGRDTPPAAGRPSGTVTFRDYVNNALVGTIGTASLNGQSPDEAPLTTSSLPVGTHQIGATYGGDAHFAPSVESPFATVTISKALTETSLQSSINPSTLGQAVTFSANVSSATGSTPTGTVQFKDGNTNIGAPKSLVGGAASLTLSTLVGGAHTIQAVYSGDTNHEASIGSLSQTVTCDRVVSGSVASVDATGTTCLTNANVGGSVKVPAGAKLSLVNSTVGGVISAASGAGPITICGTTVGGGVKITGASGFVLIGDTVEDNCAANALNSGVTLSGNTGGVELGFNRIGGSVSVTNNVGAGPGAAHASPEVQANNIGGTLGCSGNSPVVSNDGRPNSVGGGRSGECGAAGF